MKDELILPLFAPNELDDMEEYLFEYTDKDVESILKDVYGNQNEG